MFGNIVSLRIFATLIPLLSVVLRTYIASNIVFNFIIKYLYSDQYKFFVCMKITLVYITRVFYFYKWSKSPAANKIGLPYTKTFRCTSDSFAFKVPYNWENSVGLRETFIVLMPSWIIWNNASISQWWIRISWIRSLSRLLCSLNFRQKYTKK